MEGFSRSTSPFPSDSLAGVTDSLAMAPRAAVSPAELGVPTAICKVIKEHDAALLTSGQHPASLCCVLPVSDVLNCRSYRMLSSVMELSN